MQGLRELRVGFAVRRFGRVANMGEEGVEERVMGPLWGVRRPRVFVVEVPWVPGEFERAPFEVRRIERRGASFDV